MKAKPTLEISLGALAPPLLAQIAGCGREINAKDAASLQKIADAISRLSVRAILTDRETHKARRRLMKLIAMYVKKPK